MKTPFSLWGTGVCGDADNTSSQVQQGCPVSPGSHHPEHVQASYRTISALPASCPRGTHRPLGYGGSAGSASSPPGWGSGWRPGGGQLTSMWSHSYQNPHCSQRFHPEQRQRRQVFNKRRRTLRKDPRGHREPLRPCSEGWMAFPLTPSSGLGSGS